MTSAQWLTVFSLDGSRYALYLAAVDRIVPAAAITKLPKAPEIVIGVINIKGNIVPVINIRKRFNHPDRDLYPNNHFIIAHASSRLVVLIADQVHGVAEYTSSAVTPADDIVPGTDYVKGIMKMGDGIVLIHDLDTFLSLEEQSALDLAMTQNGNGDAAPAY